MEGEERENYEIVKFETTKISEGVPEIIRPGKEVVRFGDRQWYTRGLETTNEDERAWRNRKRWRLQTVSGIQTWTALRRLANGHGVYLIRNIHVYCIRSRVMNIDGSAKWAEDVVQILEDDDKPIGQDRKMQSFIATSSNPVPLITFVADTPSAELFITNR